MHAKEWKKEAMGHPQPPTPIQTNNSTADGIINSWIQPKRTKAMDMRFHWLRDGCINQRQFRFYWRPGTLQRGDYYTKHHSPAHHRNMRSEILTPYRCDELPWKNEESKRIGVGHMCDPSAQDTTWVGVKKASLQGCVSLATCKCIHWSIFNLESKNFKYEIHTSFRVFYNEEFAEEKAHKLVTTLLCNHHSCHCLAT